MSRWLFISWSQLSQWRRIEVSRRSYSKLEYLLVSYGHVWACVYLLCLKFRCSKVIPQIVSVDILLMPRCWKYIIKDKWWSKSIYFESQKAKRCHINWDKLNRLFHLFSCSSWFYSVDILNLLQCWVVNRILGLVVLDDGNQTKDNSFIYVSNEWNAYLLRLNFGVCSFSFSNGLCSLTFVELFMVHLEFCTFRFPREGIRTKFSAMNLQQWSTWVISRHWNLMRSDFCSNTNMMFVFRYTKCQVLLSCTKLTFPLPSFPLYIVHYLKFFTLSKVFVWSFA